jgi:hypothetical protein
MSLAPFLSKLYLRLMECVVYKLDLYNLCDCCFSIVSACVDIDRSMHASL